MPYKDKNKENESRRKLRKKFPERYKKYAQNYKSKNRDKINKQSRDYYNKNRDQILEKRKNRVNKIDRAEYNKEYRLKNKEKIKEYHKKYRLNNKEKINEKRKKYSQEYYLKNKEKINDKRKEYHKKNYKKKITVKIKLTKEEKDKRRKEYAKEYILKNKERRKEYAKEYRLKNKEKIKEYHKKYRLNNKDKVAKRSKKHYELNKDIIFENRKKYFEENSTRVKEQNNIRAKSRYKNEINFSLRMKLSNRLRNAMKSSGGKKILPTEILIGCNIQYLKKHLENKFSDKITWKNRDEWHIDHIIPCDFFINNFDFSIENVQRVCFNFSNLQPLNGKENIKKGKYFMVNKNDEKIDIRLAKNKSILIEFIKDKLELLSNDKLVNLPINLKLDTFKF